MGRANQPIELLLAKGNVSHLTKAEIKARQEQELKANSEKCLIPPKFLSKKLKNRYIELATELNELEILTNLDVNALAFYIINETKYQEISKKIIKAEVGTEEYEILLRQQEKLHKMLRASASDMGLTITSRCKLVVPKASEDKSKNPFLELV